MCMTDKKIQRIYVAGPITPKGYHSVHPVIDYLHNMKELIRWSLEVLKLGYDPFCPALDFMYFILLRDQECITEAMIKRYSKSWLSVCDAVMLTPGWRKSTGTLAEIQLAENLGIPVFKSFDELKEHGATNE